VNRRSTAVVVAFVLLVACGASAIFVTVPYVRFSPGPTINVLGSPASGKPIVEVVGHKTFKTTGQLRMTTVSTTQRGDHITFGAALSAWADPKQAVYPYDAIYPGNISRAEDQSESQMEMVSSQDTATAAALTELGYKLTPKPEVLRTVPGGAAEGKLMARDTFVAINGTAIKDVVQVSQIISALKPGASVRIDVLRGGKPRSVTLTTQLAPADPARPDDPRKTVIGIFVGVGYDFPFQVTVNIPDQIGGPSAGLIFSLAIYDTLTPGPLAAEVPIAGTGTIDEKGKVGPIGGIEQKIAGAEADGAKVFLVPPDNCDEAVLAKTDLKLIRADTMHSALESIKTYVADPDAQLPACPKTTDS
jgi:PDZ domain-containing protein